MLLLTLALTSTSWAQDCDPEPIKIVLEESTPAMVPVAFRKLAECDAAAAKEMAADALGKTLAGDAGHQAIAAAIKIGADDSVRTWLSAQESSGRADALAFLGTQCTSSNEVANFFASSHAAVGDSFWTDRWYRGLAECRTEGIQKLLSDFVDAKSQTAAGASSSTFSSVLEVYSRNLGGQALAKLVSLANTLTSEEELIYVVSAFADAAQVGSVAGADKKITEAAISEIVGISGKLPPRAVDQARQILTTLGAERESDSMAGQRWRDRKTDGKYTYGAIATENVTCKNGKTFSTLHYATFNEPGDQWPSQLKDLIGEKITFEWELEAFAKKCKGTPAIEVKMNSEPFAGEEAAKAFFDEERQAFRKAAPAGAKVVEQEHPAFEM